MKSDFTKKVIELKELQILGKNIKELPSFSSNQKDVENLSSNQKEVANLSYKQKSNLSIGGSGQISHEFALI